MDLDPTIRTPREKPSRDFYLAYLNSGSWRITRNRALKLAGYRCKKCGTNRDLQVHHKTYERLGREWDQDLEVLCAGCHDDHHDIERAKAGDSLRLYLKIVGMVIHGAAVATYADLAEAVKDRCAKLKIPYDGDRIGHAIALVAGKTKSTAPTPIPADLVASHEPLNKAEALRIMFELADKNPVIRSMPEAAPSPIDIYTPVRDDDEADHDRY